VLLFIGLGVLWLAIIGLITQWAEREADKNNDDDYNT